MLQSLTIEMLLPHFSVEEFYIKFLVYQSLKIETVEGPHP